MRPFSLKPRLDTTAFGTAAAQLADPDSTLDIALDPASTGGVPFRLWSTYVDPDLLPGGRLPDSRKLPALLTGERWDLLPPKC